MPLLSNLYKHLCKLTSEAMEIKSENISHEILFFQNKNKLKLNDPKSIVDRQIYRFGFYSPYDLFPQKDGWDCFQLFLLNAVNGDGAPWIVQDKGRSPHRRVRTQDIEEVNTAFNKFASEEYAISIDDRRKLFLNIAQGNSYKGIPHELEQILRVPDKYPKYNWRYHAAQTIQLFDLLNWWDPRQLDDMISDNGLSNNEKINDISVSKAWRLVYSFNSGIWKNRECKVCGVSSEKGSNFFADAGFLNFAKPDIHVRRVYHKLFGVNIKDTKSAFYKHYSIVSKILDNEPEDANKIFPSGFKARHLDRMIWLICSGRLFGNTLVVHEPALSRAEKIAEMMSEFLENYE